MDFMGNCHIQNTIKAKFHCNKVSHPACIFVYVCVCARARVCTSTTTNYSVQRKNNNNIIIKKWDSNSHETWTTWNETILQLQACAGGGGRACDEIKFNFTSSFYSIFLHTVCCAMNGLILNIQHANLTQVWDLL